MAKDVQVLTGELVAACADAYQPFKDRDSGELRAGGTTYCIFVSPGFATAPVEVKVTDPALFGQLAGAGFGALVEVTCELSARNNKIGRKAIKGATLVRDSKSAPVPAAVGANGTA